MDDEQIAEVADGRHRHLRRGILRLAVTAVVVALLVTLLPGLGHVRSELMHISAGWLASAIGFELLSSVAYVLLFHRTFCPGVKWRVSARIGLSELGVDTLVPAGGASGLALGAWVLRRRGLARDRIPGLTVAFFLVTSMVNFAAVIVLGFGLWLGVFAGRGPIELTLVPAVLATVVLAVFVSLPRLLARSPGLVRPSGGRVRRAARAALNAIAGGITETLRLLRSGDPAIYAGTIGYWAFDNAVLWVTFRALGQPPALAVVGMAYLIGQLGGALPIPLGVGGVDGGLIGSFVLFHVPLALTASAVLAYRAIQIGVPAVLGGVALTQLRRALNVDSELRSVGASASMSPPT